MLPSSWSLPWPTTPGWLSFLMFPGILPCITLHCVCVCSYACANLASAVSHKLPEDRASPSQGSTRIKKSLLPLPPSPWLSWGLALGAKSQPLTNVWDSMVGVTWPVVEPQFRGGGPVVFPTPGPLLPPNL